MAVAAQAGPAKSQTPQEAARQLEFPTSATTAGLYTIEDDYTFNVLDAVSFDKATGELTLAGHFDRRFNGPKIPYLQHLSALLGVAKPEFTLTWTPESEARVDALFARELTSGETDQIAGFTSQMLDPSGRVTPLGAGMLSKLPAIPHRRGSVAGLFGRGGRLSQRWRGPGDRRRTGLPRQEAGIAPGDIIQTVGGSRPLYPAEFLRLVRFAGATASVTSHCAARRQDPRARP